MQGKLLTTSKNDTIQYAALPTASNVFRQKRCSALTESKANSGRRNFIPAQVLFINGIIYGDRRISTEKAYKKTRLHIANVMWALSPFDVFPLQGTVKRCFAKASWFTCKWCLRDFMQIRPTQHTYCSKKCKDRTTLTSYMLIRKQTSWSTLKMMRYCTVCGTRLSFFSEKKWILHGKMCSSCYCKVGNR